MFYFSHMSQSSPQVQHAVTQKLFTASRTEIRLWLKAVHTTGSHDRLINSGPKQRITTMQQSMSINQNHTTQWTDLNHFLISLDPFLIFQANFADLFRLTCDETIYKPCRQWGGQNRIKINSGFTIQNVVWTDADALFVLMLWSSGIHFVFLFFFIFFSLYFPSGWCCLFPEFMWAVMHGDQTE